MNADMPPEIVITTTKVETIKVEGYVVQIVARLLARRDGKNPDDDIRGFGTLAHIEEPKNRVWWGYRNEARNLLVNTFRP